MFDSFDFQDIDVPGATIRVGTVGQGPALLLLHGYPQTHAMWHHLAPELTANHRVVVADLRGYGDSIAHDEDFSFRAMASDMVQVMHALGEEHFHVVAHDRGARTAHRMSLDHPDSVLSLALLDILPTLSVWKHMDAWLAKRYYHWLFLAQPGDMPQRLIASDPVGYLHSALGGLSGPLETFAPDALAAYETAARNPTVVAAWCADYAAAADIDITHDSADLGRTSTIPTLVLWGSRGVVGAQTNPLDEWRAWFPAVTGQAIEAGHFLVEERSLEVLAALNTHLGAATQRT